MADRALKTHKPDRPAAPEALPVVPLALLRAELARRGLDGFLVPRADEHQGEYVPPNAQRLKWLTGFTGSAGMAVVLADQAAVFVDGRYTLQAAAEVDGRAFKLLHLIEQPPHAWLLTALTRDARLGYDPWLHTPDGVARFRAACEKAGAHLVACPDNPLDAVWHDRPAPPSAPIVSHALAYSGRDSADKRKEIAGILAAEGLDAAVLSAPDSIAWLLNVRGDDVEYSPLPLSFALIHKDETIDLFCDPKKISSGLPDHLGAKVRLHPPAALAGALSALSGRRVRLDSASAPSWFQDRLTEANAAIIPGADPCQLPKACKNPVELDGMRRAHLRDGVALAKFLCWLEETAPAGGISEIAAADKLESYRAQGDLWRGPSFPTIAGAGPHGAIVHYRADPKTQRMIEPGQLLLLDSGGQYLDATTDVTRTVAIGHVGAEERRNFTLVLKGHIALSAARFPKGTTGSQLDVLARQPLWSEGLDFDHGTGHGVGSFLSVHEGPQRISKMPSTQALLPGMVVSDEPGYYKEGAYGIRIENLIVVNTAAGLGERPMLEFEVLTLAPIDLALVERGLLDDREVKWLNAYHQRVREMLTPLLDEKTGRWLAQATRHI
jgi:Xaa-Pro aminopeptidase